MLYTKTKPTGIDKPIQETQKLLHDRLNSLWGIELKGYGRADLLKRDDQVIPEVFVNGKDYEDILGLDDNRFFFVQDDKSESVDAKWYETDVNIYFILKLTDIKTNITHRADQEVHDDIINVLKQSSLDTVTSIETGIDNVISDFKITDMDNFNLSDFQPYHIFKVVTSVKYNLKTTNCNL